jgi:hypothetical protein
MFPLKIKVPDPLRLIALPPKAPLKFDAPVKFPVTDKVAGLDALYVKTDAPEPIFGPAVIFAINDVGVEEFIVNAPPCAALVPPPTNVAVMAAFVMSATFTFVSMVTVNVLE